MPQYFHAASIHPDAVSLHESLVRMHFGHLSLEEMIEANRGDLAADLAIVREGIEHDIVALSDAEDDRDMHRAVDVLGALDARLFRDAFEVLLGDRYFEAEAA